MSDRDVSEHVENSLVREFLKDNLSEFVKDAQVFSEEILANVPKVNKPLVKSAGLAFYSAHILNLVSDLTWETIQETVESDIRRIFYAEPGQWEFMPNGYNGSAGQIKLIEQAILASFVSICKSAQNEMTAIIAGGLANFLGKYVALTIAGVLDEMNTNCKNCAHFRIGNTLPAKHLWGNCIKPGECALDADEKKTFRVFVWADKSCEDFEPRKKPVDQRIEDSH